MKMFEIYARMNDRQRYAVRYHAAKMGINKAVDFVYLHGVGHYLASMFYNERKNA